MACHCMFCQATLTSLMMISEAEHNSLLFVCCSVADILKSDVTWILQTAVVMFGKERVKWCDSCCATDTINTAYETIISQSWLFFQTVVANSGNFLKLLIQVSHIYNCLYKTCHLKTLNCILFLLYYNFIVNRYK